MKKFTILLGIILLTSPAVLYSQKEMNIWYFGNYAGLDFNSGDPIPLLNSSMKTYDNCTTVSDSAGNLLFYSNGVTVWNKYHTPMPNGQGLFGATSSTNGSIAVQQPAKPDIYYIFTNDEFAGPYGLRYSVVDMSLNSGNGDVTSQKNIPILMPDTEKTLAVYHENNTDIWIIAHEWNSNAFHAYLLTENGLSTTPVISTVGSYHTGGTLGTYNSMGQIAATTDGLKIGLAIYDFQQYELFDFNRSTGTLSNPIIIPGYPNAWGVEFSPDGSKLYTTCWKFSPVYQFDISSNNAITIINSVVQIGDATSPDPEYSAGFLQTGPDNKIYIAKYNSEFLASINNPNEPGILCEFYDNSVYLGGRLSLAGLPSFIKSETSLGLKKDFESQNYLKVYPNPACEKIYVQVQTKWNSTINISLVALNGKSQHIHYTGTVKEGESTIELDLESQPSMSFDPGIYILQISLDGKSFMRKISIIGN